MFTKKNHTKTPLDLINEYRKAAEYKINIQKSIIFLQTFNKQSENKINKIFISKASKK